MTKKFKWQIKELKYSKQLKKYADIILQNRVKFLIDKVNNYFEDKSAENLHQLRIALRRVRYPMEVFFVCYNRKIFIKFYNKIQKLQDLSGAARDIDIVIEKINSSSECANNLELKSFILQLSSNKEVLQKIFDEELNKFIKSKIFKDFYTK